MSSISRISCLRGFGGALLGLDSAGILADGHVYALERLNDTIVLRDLGPHAEIAEAWRIDQIALAGAHLSTPDECADVFALPHARSQAMDTFMARRRQILSQSALSAEDEAELAALEKQQGTLPTGETLQELKTIMLMQTLAAEGRNAM